jgi:ABC-type transport system, involved in lipoprotein release, permease component
MLRFAIGNLLSRPLRSLLALMGLAIAIGGMVALFSIAQGIDHVVTKTFKQIPGMAVQQRGAPVPLFSTLPARWGEEIAALPGVLNVDAEVVQRLNILEGKTLIAPPRFVVGLDLNVRPRLLRDVYRENMIAGRYFDSSDTGTGHCIISKQIADETRKGVGDSLRLNDSTFEVIGIYNTGSALLDVNILMDLPSAQKLMRIDPNTISIFYVEPEEGVDHRQLRDQIEALFLNRSVNEDLATTFSLKRTAEWLLATLQTSGLDRSATLPSAVSSKTTDNSPTPTETATTDVSGDQKTESTSAVEVRLSEDWSDRFSEFTGDLKLFLMLITTMAVAIAVLSIVNTMTMSVSERMIEFGILRANGWSKGNLIQLMTFESGLLGICGGLLGALIGWVISLVVNSLYPDRLQLYVSVELLILAVGLSVTLGILGGLYPAWLAARRSPMDAIRRG